MEGHADWHTLPASGALCAQSLYKNRRMTLYESCAIPGEPSSPSGEKLVLLGTLKQRPATHAPPLC